MFADVNVSVRWLACLRLSDNSDEKAVIGDAHMFANASVSFVWLACLRLSDKSDEKAVMRSSLML